MIYHAVYYFDSLKDARLSSGYFSSKLVKGFAHVFHGDGVNTPYHVHLLVDVARGVSPTKEVFNVPGFKPASVEAVDDLYAVFDYMIAENPLTLLWRYGSLEKKYKDYLRANGLK